MRAPVEKPKITATPNSPVSDYVETHPAYAQIGAARCTGRVNLYGSDFDHRNFVKIDIHRSELNRGHSNDRPFATEEYIEVWLSEAQWATLVSSMNVGQGVQCTLKYRNGKAIADLPAPAPRTEQFKAEATKTLKDAQDLLRQLRELMVARRSPKEQISLLDRAFMNIECNVDFVAEQFGEHMEETIERAKIEVNAHVTNTLARLGLEQALSLSQGGRVSMADLRAIGESDGGWRATGCDPENLTLGEALNETCDQYMARSGVTSRCGQTGPDGFCEAHRSPQPK